MDAEGIPTIRLVSKRVFVSLPQATSSVSSQRDELQHGVAVHSVEMPALKEHEDDSG